MTVTKKLRNIQYFKVNIYTYYNFIWFELWELILSLTFSIEWFLCTVYRNHYIDNKIYILRIGICLGNRSERFKTNGFIRKTGFNRYLKVVLHKPDLPLPLPSGRSNSLEKRASSESSSVLVLFSFFLILISNRK